MGARRRRAGHRGSRNCRLCAAAGGSEGHRRPARGQRRVHCARIRALPEAAAARTSPRRCRAYVRSSKRRATSVRRRCDADQGAASASDALSVLRTPAVVQGGCLPSASTAARAAGAFRSSARAARICPISAAGGSRPAPPPGPNATVPSRALASSKPSSVQDQSLTGSGGPGWPGGWPQVPRPPARSLETRTRLPLDLLIFSPSSPTMPAWAKCLASGHTGERVRVPGAHLVVREDQVRAAALHGEGCGQVLLGDDGAFDVPAGPALAQARRRASWARRRGPRATAAGPAPGACRPLPGSPPRSANSSSISASGSPETAPRVQASRPTACLPAASTS